MPAPPGTATVEGLAARATFYWPPHAGIGGIVVPVLAMSAEEWRHNWWLCYCVTDVLDRPLDHRRRPIAQPRRLAAAGDTRLFSPTHLFTPEP